jgi:hypothetical protein
MLIWLDEFEKLASRWRDDYAHQARFSDGEVYQKIRRYQNLGDGEMENEWKARLTPGKQQSVDRLLGHEGFKNAFDDLLSFPGLWGGLKLGNIQRHLALRCDEAGK